MCTLMVKDALGRFFNYEQRCDGECVEKASSGRSRFNRDRDSRGWRKVPKTAVGLDPFDFHNEIVSKKVCWCKMKNLP